MASDESTLRHLARDAFIMARFLRALEVGCDYFVFTSQDAAAYSGIDAPFVLAGLGPGWSTREQPVMSFEVPGIRISTEPPEGPTPPRVETVFRREIDASKAINQIKARLSAR